MFGPHPLVLPVNSHQGGTPTVLTGSEGGAGAYDTPNHVFELVAEGEVDRVALEIRLMAWPTVSYQHPLLRV